MVERGELWNCCVCFRVVEGRCIRGVEGSEDARQAEIRFIHDGCAHKLKYKRIDDTVEKSLEYGLMGQDKNTRNGRSKNQPFARYGENQKCHVYVRRFIVLAK